MIETLSELAQPILQHWSTFDLMSGDWMVLGQESVESAGTVAEAVEVNGVGVAADGPGVEAGGPGEATDPVDPADQPFLVRLLNNPLFLPAGVMLIFYLVFLGPERRRKLEEAKRLAAIGKNDRVVTSGGIHGVVVSAPQNSDVLTVRIDDNNNIRVKVSRWALTAVKDESEKDGSGKSGKDDR